MTKGWQRSDCPISSALDIFGDKWTLLVVRDLLFRGKSTYGQFLGSDEKIATNILADRLRLLVHENIISHRPNPSDGRLAYVLTAKGIDLLPMLIEMILWSAQHLAGVAAPASFMQQLNKNKSGVIRKIRSDLTKDVFLFPVGSSRRIQD